MINKIKKIAFAIKNLAFKHKIISLLILLVLIGGGYWEYKSLNNTTGVTRYVLSAVEKGNIISSVSGTGQVSAVNEVNITPKTSGDLTYVGVQNGQNVVSGQLLAKIDTTDAQKAVDIAQINLDQAQLNLKNMQGFTTDVGEKRGIKQKAQDNLTKAREDGYNTVTNAFVNLPIIMVSFHGILFDYTLSSNQQNIDFYTGNTPTAKDAAYNSYQLAKVDFDNSFAIYKLTNRSSSPAEIDTLINETYSTIKVVADAIKTTMNLIQLYQDELTKVSIPYNALSDTHLSILNGYTNTLNGYLSSLLSSKTNIETNTETLIQTDYDLSSQEITVREKQIALDDAKKTLSYCSIRAPFDGVLSSVNAETGDLVSTNTTIATILTKKQMASISLNEVDAAKILINQKVTFTFDAIDNLTITGKVTEVDTLGTVSQGVVSYNAKIIFDTQDARIKPGMSVSANIITETKQNILVVPNSAVKSRNGIDYVLVMDQKQDLTNSSASQGFISATTPTQKTIEIGLSDNNNTEVTNGLDEGDQIISKTITSTTTASTTKTTSTSSTNRAATQTLMGAGGPPN